MYKILTHQWGYTGKLKKCCGQNYNSRAKITIKITLKITIKIKSKVTTKTQAQ